MKLKHLFEILIFRCAALVLQRLPFRAVGTVGGFLGEFVFSVLRYRQDVTMTNLRKAFPEKHESELRTIARNSFRNVGISLCEFMCFPKLNIEAMKSLCTMDNSEVLMRAIAKGHGVIVLTAHFGNWELVGPAVLTHAGVPMLMIVKTQSNPIVDKVINSWRSKLGNTVIPMESSLREVVRALQDGGILGIAADQTSPSDSVLIKFFGRNVPTFEGPARFSLMSGAPIVGVFVIRQHDGSYLVHVEEVASNDIQGSREEQVSVLTERHVRMTESVIRNHPDQWMWMHKRWKHVDNQPERTS